MPDEQYRRLRSKDGFRGELIKIVEGEQPPKRGDCATSLIVPESLGFWETEGSAKSPLSPVQFRRYRLARKLHAVIYEYDEE